MDEYQEAFDMLEGFVHLHPNPGLCWFQQALQAAYQMPVLSELGAVLYQEQNENDRVIGYASRALSKSESHYPAH